jgi:DNA invertase Pin-like site-specific DNA recombinase
MLVGYARVSTMDQHLDLQHDALKQARCEKTFEDTMSGAKAERPGLQHALAYLREGDTLVVWKLDRLGRSLRDLITIVADLETRRIGFKSLQESIDTTTPGGRLIFHVFAALAEFERDIIRERTHAGLTAARARGRKGGKKPKLTGTKLDMAMAMMGDRRFRVIDIAQQTGVHRSLLYKRYKEYTARQQQAAVSDTVG